MTSSASSADAPRRAGAEGRDASETIQPVSLYEAKARAELALADASAPGSDLVPGAGAPLARTMLLKGLPGPAERVGGSALCGADGDAAALALAALGYDPEDTFRLVSRPEPGIKRDRCANRLRLAVEAVDPHLVVALDAEAAEDLAQAFGVAPLRFGKPAIVLGRTLLAVDGLEASLTDPVRKRRVWRQLQTVRVRAR